MRPILFKISIIISILLVSGTGDAMDKKLEKATFAGGCFWCMTAPFENTKGVIKVTAGYTGGTKTDPTYEEVSTGRTGHVEAVEVIYDPSEVSYFQLLDVFWKNVDPTDSAGQFTDKGHQYKTIIFYNSETERRLAEGSKEKLASSGKFKEPIVTEIKEVSRFYPAEEYHQDYYKKKPIQYELYKHGSGRDAFLKKMWGKNSPDNDLPPKDELKKRLSPMQYNVTQECGTEPPFKNEYWDNKKEGIYVDRVSGEALFSSLDKFDSGTGWPSFTRPLEDGNIMKKEDSSHGMERTEVKSVHAGSHLGHLFPGGPKPTGMRYCINSAALRFVPKEDLEKEGYGKYKVLFER